MKRENRNKNINYSPIVQYTHVSDKHQIGSGRDYVVVGFHNYFVILEPEPVMSIFAYDPFGTLLLYVVSVPIGHK